MTEVMTRPRRDSFLILLLLLFLTSALPNFRHFRSLSLILGANGHKFLDNNFGLLYNIKKYFINLCK